MNRLKSISAFFPAFNDGGTISSMVISALRTLTKVTDDFEVIVVNDGSQDYTGEMLEELERIYPQVRIVTHPQNRGYGAALRSGFAAARKDWIFYTDGDAQYDPRELVKLVEAVQGDTDIVNGYKIERQDPLHRVVIGRTYHHLVRLLFGFRLRDVDCDFRLIRRKVFERVRLQSTSGTICLEMVKKFQDMGCRFAEVPVHHFHRAYGKSQFFNFARLVRTAIQLFVLWRDLFIRKTHMRSLKNP
ncbi:MAG: glycosyltransferase family 2 protein [Thermodesulfobacteriota bacterium]